MEEHKTVNILVIWRCKRLNLEINSEATLKELGNRLLHLTNVKSDTMRLLTPRSSDNSSKLLTPFSDNHSTLSLKEASILEGKSVRMMGVFEDEIKEVSHNGTKADLRIAGFDEEERRLRQRMSGRSKNLLKLPQGAYIFCDFRTLHLPRIALNPPASEALKRMHRLAADPGIVAIMNKHRWRVGVMTEMAPVGYVGVSPMCILGYNKNQGDEISLRLRTDDLKGFRKYESIKKTLLHELAHMVYSEHDADFYALDKQLNQEAASLDWTRSRSHTLSGLRISDNYEEEYYEEMTDSRTQKLGGINVDGMATACSSVAAAYRRLGAVSTEPDPDDSGCKVHVQPDPDDCVMEVEIAKKNDKSTDFENLDHEEELEDQIKFDDHKNSWFDEAMETELYAGICANEDLSELNPHGCEKFNHVPRSTINGRFVFPMGQAEPDPDDREASDSMLQNGLAEPDPDDSLPIENLGDKNLLLGVSQEPHADDIKMKRSMSRCWNFAEPDPDDLLNSESTEDSINKVKRIQEKTGPDDFSSNGAIWVCGNNLEPDPDPDDAQTSRIMEHDDLQTIESGADIIKVSETQKSSEIDASFMEKTRWQSVNNVEHDPGDSRGNTTLQHESDPDDSNDRFMDTSNRSYDVLGPNSQELQRIQDPVSVICTRLQKTLEMLKSEVPSVEATSVLQTLFKIIRNVIEHPDEIKFRRLRKANPQFQRNVAKYKAAMDVLFIVGFNEDRVSDEIGRSEVYVVLKRDDPGLLWLAKSSLEMCIAY